MSTSQSAVQGRRKDTTGPSQVTFYPTRILLGAIIGSGLGLWSFQVASVFPAEVARQLPLAAMLSLGLTLLLMVSLRWQMQSIRTRSHWVKVDGVKQEIRLRRRPEVLRRVVRRFGLGALGLGAGLAVAGTAVVYASGGATTWPMILDWARSSAQLPVSGSVLLFSFVVSAVSLVSAELTFRATVKAGMPHQVEALYLPIVTVSIFTLLTLAGHTLPM